MSWRRCARHPADESPPIPVFAARARAASAEDEASTNRLKIASRNSPAAFRVKVSATMRSAGTSRSSSSIYRVASRWVFPEPALAMMRWCLRPESPISVRSRGGRRFSNSPSVAIPLSATIEPDLSRIQRGREEKDARLKASAQRNNKCK